MYKGIRLGLPVAVSVTALALPATLGASSVAAPRLAGRFQTSLTITYAKNISGLKAGDHAVKTWTFVPTCASGGCTTRLNRPSIAAGSTTVYIYKLKPTSAREYKGNAVHVVVECVLYSNGQHVPGSYVSTHSMTLKVTKVSGGKVVAYTGTDKTVLVPTATGKARGCTTGEQLATFKG